MTHLRGALGWMFVAAMAMVLGACDDPQKNCHDVVNKYDECAPKIIDESLKALPEHFAPMLEEKKGELTQKLDATVAELRSQCQGGTFSDSEKRQFRLWRSCVLKECSEFTKCMKGEK